VAVRIVRDDLIAGVLFIGIGACFAFEALNYPLGTPFRMGPGFMPVGLGAILVVIGLSVIFKGWRSAAPDEAKHAPPWRALGLIGLAIIFFGVTIRGLGFIPTVFVTALITSLASRMNNIVAALAIALGLTVLCALVFAYGLRVPVPLFGPWLRF
jgi:hypothetical protein